MTVNIWKRKISSFTINKCFQDQFEQRVSMKYAFDFKMKGIKVQAKTPTGNMVVFDVPEIKTTLSNYERSETVEIVRKFDFGAYQDRMIIDGRIELKLALMCQRKDF